MATRNELIRAVHTAKRTLMMDDATYRDVLRNATGKTSCEHMSDDELRKVLDHCRKAGFAAKEDPATAPMRRMVFALWQQMHQEGIVRSPESHAMDAYSLRMVRRVPAQCSVKQLQHLIECLKKWWDREGTENARRLLDGILAGRVSFAGANARPAVEGTDAVQ